MVTGSLSLSKHFLQPRFCFPSSLVSALSLTEWKLWKIVLNKTGVRPSANVYQSIGRTNLDISCIISNPYRIVCSFVSFLVLLYQLTKGAKRGIKCCLMRIHKQNGKTNGNATRFHSNFLSFLLSSLFLNLSFLRRMDRQTDGQTIWCHFWIVLDYLFVLDEFCRRRNTENDIFRRLKIHVFFL